MTLHGKKLGQYNIEGALIGVYNSVVGASRAVFLSQTAIEDCILGKKDCTTHGIWRAFDNTPPATIDVRGLQTEKFKPVYQYTLVSVLAKRWNTVAEAACTVGRDPRGIMAAIKWRTTCGGFYWSYFDHQTFPPKERCNEAKDPVGLFDLEGKMISKFKSVSGASIATRLAKSVIQENLDGVVERTVLGVWKYLQPAGAMENPDAASRKSPNSKSNRQFAREDVIRVQAEYSSYVEKTSNLNRGRATAYQSPVLSFPDWLELSYPTRPLRTIISKEEAIQLDPFQNIRKYS